jgi:hypothetical protein
MRAFDRDPATAIVVMLGKLDAEDRYTFDELIRAARRSAADERLPAPRRWVSCGHLAAEVCFQCYVARGKELAETTRVMQQLQIKLSRAGGALIDAKTVHADNVEAGILELTAIIERYRAAWPVAFPRPE